MAWDMFFARLDFVFAKWSPLFPICDTNGQQLHGRRDEIGISGGLIAYRGGRARFPTGQPSARWSEYCAEL
jgi:hypothetical protein